MARAKNEEFNQIKYQNEFKKANYDRVEILVKKGERAIIKEIAAAAGQNVSEYINQAIKERMERDQRMTIGENSTLNIRLTNTFSGAQSDAEYDTDGKLITRPTHALENNGEKLTITGEGSDPNTTGTINFVTNNIGHRIKLKYVIILILSK